MDVVVIAALHLHRMTPASSIFHWFYRRVLRHTSSRYLSEYFGVSVAEPEFMLRSVDTRTLLFSLILLLTYQLKPNANTENGMVKKGNIAK